jgi:cytochrome c biogenesis protein CcmG/thiol:disulfide interchange protein DsbE
MTPTETRAAGPSNAHAITPVRRSGRRRLLTALAILAPALAILGLLAYGFTIEPRYIPTPFIAKPAPPFTLTLFDGRTMALEELRGKVVFLNFWASWCPPCRAEARMLEAAWLKYRDQGVVFLGVNIQDEEESARGFIREFAITYPNGLDRGARIAIEYGVWGLPETFFVDREGRITYKHVGALGWETVAIKLEEAAQGVVSASEGRGEYQSSR